MTILLGCLKQYIPTLLLQSIRGPSLFERKVKWLSAVRVYLNGQSNGQILQKGLLDSF